MNKKTSCTTCKKRKACKELCPSMLELLYNTKANNGIYSEARINAIEIPISNYLESILFTKGFSDIEYRDASRIIIAILSPIQKQILMLHSEGITQSEIAKSLGVSQANISRKFKTIRNVISQSFVEVLPHIL